MASDGTYRSAICLLLLIHFALIQIDCKDHGTLEWCNINPTSKGHFVKGVFPPLAVEIENKTMKTVLIQVYVALKQNVSLCKFAIQHDYEDPKHFLLNREIQHGWKVDQPNADKIFLSKTISEDNKMQTEGKYTLTFNNSETTQFYVIFSNQNYPKDLENAQTLYKDDEFRINVTNRNFANCVDLNNWIKPGFAT